MADLFKRLGDYGTAGISGKIIEVQDDVVIAFAHNYDKVQKQNVEVVCAINMTEVGGTDSIEPGMNITALGQMQGEDEQKRVIIVAKAADIGNCRVVYNGFGIVSGEATYALKTNKKTGEPFLDAKFNTINRDTEQKVSNHIRINPYKGDTSTVDRMVAKLERSATDCKLQTKTGCERVFEQYPYDSAFAFRVNPDYEEPRPFTPEGKDVTYYTRNNFAFSPSVYNIGFPMVNLIKEREAASREYNDQKGFAVPEPQAPAKDMEPAGQQKVPFDEGFEMDYGE